MRAARSAGERCGRSVEVGPRVVRRGGVRARRVRWRRERVVREVRAMRERVVREVRAMRGMGEVEGSGRAARRCWR